MALEKTQRRAADIFICSMMSVRKVKTLKKPHFEPGELMELPGEGSSPGKTTGAETGTEAEQAAGYEPTAQESVYTSDF